MTEEEKAKFLMSRGWTESCLQDNYWNPPKGVKLPPLEPPPETGSGWDMAVGLRLVVTTDEAYAYETEGIHILLDIEDPLAQDLLWTYAQRRRSVDTAFSADLERCLRNAGYEPPPATGTKP